MVGILTAKTRGLTDKEGFDNLRILYISLRLYFFMAVKPFLLVILQSPSTLAGQKKTCQDGTQYHSTMIL
jgi:hypothetical protein